MGDMFINATELASLPSSGAAWTSLTDAADASWPSPDLGALDGWAQTYALAGGLVYRKTGTSSYKTKVVNAIKAVMGTETSAPQPLNPYRQIGTWIAAADMVDMDPTTVGANGKTLQAWIQGLCDATIPGQTNWNSVRKCASTSGNNWGSYARASMTAIAVWLSNRGLSSTGTVQTGAAMLTEVKNYVRRWLGDTSVANTFTPSSGFNSAWVTPGSSYPSGQGTVNGAGSDPVYDGVSVEDASRGTSVPPTINSDATSYFCEGLDAMCFAAILLHHTGYTTVWTLQSNALKRAMVRFARDNNLNGSTANATGDLFKSRHFPIPQLINFKYGTSLTEVQTVPQSRTWSYAEWLTGSGSTWLGAGANPPPTIVLAVTNTAGTLTAVANVTGSTNATSYVIGWGDTSTTTITEPTHTASHTYASAGAYTVTVTATGSGGTSSVTAPVTVAVDHPPVAVITLSGTTGSSTVSYDCAGTVDPDGDTITRSIAWGDGNTTSSAAATGTHTYTPGSYPASYSVTLTATANSAATSTTRTWTVADPATFTARTGRLFVVDDLGSDVPVFSEIPYRTINTYTGTRTFALTDAGVICALNSASDRAWTIPANATVQIPTGTSIDLLQVGAGGITVTAASGVTLVLAPGRSATTGGAGDRPRLLKTAINTWILS
jgi:PKD repeat protein